MPISESEVKRLNVSMPVANDVKLGEIIKALQESSGGTITVAWSDIDGKPSTFSPSTHTHTIANVTNLQTSLDAKLTAIKAAPQANSTATDIAGLVTDFNALLAKLKTAGVMS
ncbi:head fiber protein [Bacillus sp. DX4.1]|uniref:head fiber protein n=1 Tax=Bacillus sp. DX4.1 TaxID=3055867 RepID=UPI0025A04860|nr:head fiber protein [Bacillus sp. DX4.1]MDM5188608.1 head fiber protein [Bacillus sp. DX4.1]